MIIDFLILFSKSTNLSKPLSLILIILTLVYTNSSYKKNFLPIDIQENYPTRYIEIKEKADIYFISTKDGYLHALDKNKIEKWKIYLGKELMSTTIFIRKISNDLFLYPYNGRLFLYQDGELIPLNTFIKDLVKKQYFSYQNFSLVGSTHSTILIVDANTGEILQKLENGNMTKTQKFILSQKKDIIRVVITDYILTCFGKSEKIWNVSYTDVLIHKDDENYGWGDNRYLAPFDNIKNIIVEYSMNKGDKSDINFDDVITAYSYFYDDISPIKIYDMSESENQFDNELDKINEFNRNRELRLYKKNYQKGLSYEEEIENPPIVDEKNSLKKVITYAKFYCTYISIIILILILIIVYLILKMYKLYFWKKELKQREDTTDNCKCIEQFFSESFNEFPKKNNNFEKSNKTIEFGENSFEKLINGNNSNEFKKKKLSYDNKEDKIIKNFESNNNMTTSPNSDNNLIKKETLTEKEKNENFTTISNKIIENHQNKDESKNKNDEEENKKIKKSIWDEDDDDEEEEESDSDKKEKEDIKNNNESKEKKIFEDDSKNKNDDEDIQNKTLEEKTEKSTKLLKKNKNTEKKSIWDEDDDDDEEEEEKDNDNKEKEDEDSKKNKLNEINQNYTKKVETKLVLKKEKLNRLDTDFENLEKIGRGGFGVVLKGTHKIDKDVYAIKIINMTNKSESEEIINEAKRMKLITDKYIVNYHISWFDDNLGSAQKFFEEEDLSNSASNISFSLNKLNASTICLSKKMGKKFETHLQGIKEENEGDESCCECGNNSNKSVELNTNKIYRNPARSIIFCNINDDLKFQNESNISRKIGNHPKKGKKYFFILMEYCDGLTLENYIAQHKNGSIERKIIYNFLKQILKGLKKLHKNGIIHRDIKPGNIFIKNDQIKIGDFGLATKFKVNTTLRTKELKGFTPNYSAPEETNSSTYNEKVDIYACGITLYEMCGCFGSEMERYESLRDLRNKGIIKDKIKKNYPHESYLIEKMTEKDYNKRLSAENILESEMFKKLGELVNK